MSEPATNPPLWSQFWALLADSPRLVGLALIGLVVKLAAPPFTRAWLAVKGRRNASGPGPAAAPTPQPRLDSGPTELPLFMTRQEGEELEELVRAQGEAFEDKAGEISSKVDVAASQTQGVERRVDAHRRDLHKLREAFVDHRADTRARLDAVREKQEESCERLERVEQQQADSGALLKAVAQKLGVSAS